MRTSASSLPTSSESSATALLAARIADQPALYTIRQKHGRALRARRLVYGLIAQRRADGEDSGDVVSMLLTAQDTEGDGSELTDQQVRDQTMTLLAAGHETTS